MKKNIEPYDMIRKELFSGRWAEGDFINPQKIAKEMGISYTPVREALIRLVGEGLLHQEPNVGVCVKRLDPEELADLFDLRDVLESGAARLAALRINDHQLHALEALCPSLERIAEQVRQDPASLDRQTNERRLKLDMTFHLKIVEASGSQRIFELIKNMHILTRIFRQPFPVPPRELPDHLDQLCRFHRDILNALKQHNPEAAHAIASAHNQWAKAAMLSGVYHTREMKEEDMDAWLQGIIASPDV